MMNGANEITEEDYKFALRCLKGLQKTNNTPHIDGGLVFAISALEKQIPKRPVEKIHPMFSDIYMVCPNCRKMAAPKQSMHTKNLYYNFCKYCGQALKN